MNKEKELERLKKEYQKVEEEANALSRPLILERKRRLELIDKWFEEEYKKIQSHAHLLHDRLVEIEQRIEYLEDTILHCSWCDKPIDKYDEEAEKSGFNYCTECYEELDTCETCGSLGQYGVNTEPNNIDICWECGVTYCDNCYHECPEEEE